MSVIKILAIADLHWYTDEELVKIKKVDYDVCVLLGDIPLNAIRLIKQYTNDKPMIAVAGNHDDWNTPELGGAENIHGQCMECCGYTFAGFSGSARYKNGDYPMFTQFESLGLGAKLNKANILISHDSGYHLFGKDKPHSGLLGIDFYNLKNRVKLNVCGHHHTPTVKKRFGITTVCVFRCAIITFPDISVETVF
ncbi:MAG: metallophosphoesterase family protein [Ruminococcus flavefaciens]|nr:metallophosphoesterase family protein [Ruminococcus flavefaciens]MCM1361795.1 metallophosphoesterase family protein [Clostridiales bacterium]MCM1435644.1 metallophosphoesterase family protein [Ruminococcus flavefaciens]